MPVINVQHCLRDFEASVNSSLLLADEARAYVLRLADGTFRRVGVRNVELFAGLALLRIHVAWESFLENTFLRYMCGAKSPAGYQPILLGTGRESSISAARQKLLGSRSRYLDWTHQATIRAANQYFDLGEPFVTGLSSVSRELEEVNILRNRFAHRSDYSVTQFRMVVRRTYGYMPNGMTVGRFLLLSNPTTGSGISLEVYGNSLAGAARTIVP